MNEEQASISSPTFTLLHRPLSVNSLESSSFSKTSEGICLYGLESQDRNLGRQAHALNPWLQFLPLPSVDFFIRFLNFSS